MPQVAGIPNHERLCKDLTKKYRVMHLFVQARLRRVVEADRTEEQKERDDFMNTLLLQRGTSFVRYLDEESIASERLLLSSSHVKEEGKITSLLENYIQDTCARSLEQETVVDGKKIGFLLVQYLYELVIGGLSYEFNVTSGDEIWGRRTSFRPGEENSYFSHNDDMPKRMRDIITEACGGETFWDM
mgnify:CR=1 FL=1